MYSDFLNYCRDILCEITTNGETHEKELNFTQSAVILFMLNETELSSITKGIFRDQFFNQTIRADILAEIILCELD